MLPLISHLFAPPLMCDRNHCLPDRNREPIISDVTRTIFMADRDIPRCRKCGYRLVGLHELRCPECGTAFEKNALFRRQVPWENRKSMGIYRAYWSTLQMLLYQPAELVACCRIGTHISDSRVFRWINTISVSLPFMGIFLWCLCEGADKDGATPLPWDAGIRFLQWHKGSISNIILVLAGVQALCFVLTPILLINSAIWLSCRYVRKFADEDADANAADSLCGYLSGLILCAVTPWILLIPAIILEVIRTRDRSYVLATTGDIIIGLSAISFLIAACFMSWGILRVHWIAVKELTRWPLNSTLLIFALPVIWVCATVVAIIPSAVLAWLLHVIA